MFLSIDNEREYMYWMPLPTDNRSTHLLDSLSTADERRKNRGRRGAATVFEVATRWTRGLSIHIYNRYGSALEKLFAEEGGSAALGL